ncbi:DUF4190 domain-containing protein [Mycetocola spongiae]|nr:DUF4190 domain-containing protein [Mycetocola spongiae]
MPPAPPVAGYPAPAAPAQGYGQAPVPGKTLGIVGFILAFLGPLSLVGLVLSIVALMQSKRAQVSNGLAVAGIVVASIVLVGSIISIFGMIAVLFGFASVCGELGPGVHSYQGGTISCG